LANKIIKGIDISKWQGIPDFYKAKKDVDFVFIKTVEGIGYTDTQFIRNQKELRRLQIPRGYYAFVRPDLGNSAIKEAEYFLKQIGPLEKGEILLLDFEVTFTDKVEWCKKWLDYIYQQTKVKGLIYLNKSLQANNNWLPLINEGYGLWLADYTHNENSIVPKTQWDIVAIRQYTNRLTVSGIYNNVDGNIFYGDVNALLSYGYSGSHAEKLPIDDVKDFSTLLDIDIPSNIEKELSLKKLQGYNKHWTLREFINYCISLIQDDIVLRIFLQGINTKLSKTNPDESKNLEDEKNDLQRNVDIVLRMIQENKTKDIKTFSNEEIRNEFVKRLFDKISKMFVIKN